MSLLFLSYLQNKKEDHIATTFLAANLIFSSLDHIILTTGKNSENHVIFSSLKYFTFTSENWLLWMAFAFQTLYLKNTQKKGKLTTYFSPRAKICKVNHCSQPQLRPVLSCAALKMCENPYFQAQISIFMSCVFFFR